MSLFGGDCKNLNVQLAGKVKIFHKGSMVASGRLVSAH